MEKKTDFVLGLDLGTNSVGWALIEEKVGRPVAIRAAGVRVFPSGMEINEKSGKTESHAIERRTARQRRRMLDRQKRRRLEVLHVLQRNGFLPGGKPDHKVPEWQNILAINPYQVRAEGLDRLLSPMEFGRAIFHIAHRRGFQSNRKQTAKPGEDGIVKRETDEQETKMKAAGVRTFGEFLWKLRLNDDACRLRERYTMRSWYRDEFTALCQAQQKNGLLHLDEKVVRELREAIFYQRPLKVRPSLIGRCKLEPQRQRAAQALLISQRFRLLQDVNHAALQDETGRVTPLTPEQRRKLAETLDVQKKLTFAKARKIVGAPKGSVFNFETGGREDFTGNTTAHRIIEVIGLDAWKEMSPGTHEQVVEALMSMEDRDALCRLAQRKWKLPADAADKLADVSLEDGHIHHSSKAIKKILPHLEAGLDYANAVAKAYPDKPLDPTEARLSPVPSDLRNPIVTRSLTEMRRIVNAIVDKYGTPARIRVELARDLKKTAKARISAYTSMREREKDRNRVAGRLSEEVGIQEAKPWDKEKALLFEECGGICPYTGKGISFAALFGPNPTVHVEHIIPFSRSLDNSFANKTLCYADENVHVKHNKTPFEAYANQPEKWQAILTCVRDFRGDRDMAREKLRRFMVEDISSELDSFTTADLNNTRYASKYASQFLARLYQHDERHKRIQVSVGQTTAYLRSAWRLNEMLSPTDKKTRDDHRHHAVDAIAIALTTPATTRMLATAASRSYRPGVFEDVDLPWASLRSDVAAVLAKMVVSHRVDHKVNGSLHKTTFYGLITTAPGKCSAVLRTNVEDLSESDLKGKKIVDAAVRVAVEKKLQELGAESADIFKDPTKRPCMPNKKGRYIPIRRVRVFQDKKPVAIGTDHCRNVATGENHHAEFFEVTNGKGEKVWQDCVVTRLEAMKRKKLKQMIVAEQDGDGNPRVLFLAIGDTVKLQWNDKPVIAVVRSLSKGDYEFRPVNDAREAGDLGEDGIRISLKKMRLCGCQIVRVSPLGEIDG